MTGASPPPRGEPRPKKRSSRPRATVVRLDDVRGDDRLAGSTATDGASPDLSIVVPVMNEELTIGRFLETVKPLLDALELEWEILFVDDGSTDSTPDLIHAAHEADRRVKILVLSRNFGKEAALSAGLQFSRGAAVVPMDVDLQDPPELIARFVEKWREGYENVYGLREDRSADSVVKRYTSSLFYRSFNLMSARQIQPNAGDFRLMSRRVVEATLELRERNRFMKGLFAWVGFNTIGIPYTRPRRSAGTTKFNYWKLWNFALDGVTSFSTVPLRIWTYVGGAVALLALGYTAFIIGYTLINGRDIPGYASLLVVVLLLGAINLISLGILGEYIGRLYIESKQRPIYLVKHAAGFDEAPGQADPAPPLSVNS